MRKLQIGKIKAKIATIKEKRAAIKAENRKDEEAIDDNAEGKITSERVVFGNRGWTIYWCETCDL